jgi:hypothetical protein
LGTSFGPSYGWLAFINVRTCAYHEVMVVRYASNSLLNRSSDVLTLYVLPMEKHEYELVTSTCTMCRNVRLHDYTRHTRTLPLLNDLEDIREADLCRLSYFTEAINGTRECALDERT